MHTQQRPVWTTLLPLLPEGQMCSPSATALPTQWRSKFFSEFSPTHFSVAYCQEKECIVATSVDPLTEIQIWGLGNCVSRLVCILTVCILTQTFGPLRSTLSNEPGCGSQSEVFHIIYCLILVTGDGRGWLGTFCVPDFLPLSHGYSLPLPGTLDSHCQSEQTVLALNREMVWQP